MTRKALRKKRRILAKQQAIRPSAARSATPWVAVGALVASATFSTPATASAVEWRRSSRAGGRESVVATVLRLSELSGRRFSPDAFGGIGAAQEPQQRRFDIPAGPLAEVLNTFEAVAGIEVGLSLESIGTIQSPGVKGLFTIQRALEELLVGTSVTFRMESPTRAVLEIRTQAESVQVTGIAPTAVVSSPKYVVPMRTLTSGSTRRNVENGLIPSVAA